MDAKPLILIADDEPEILGVYRDKLAAAGFEIMTAENGEQAVTLANQRKPDLILMDVKMPVMDGAEAVAKIKGNPALADVKVLFITAFADSHAPGVDVKFAAEAGAEDFIVKGIDLQDLVDRVKKTLGLNK